MQNEQDVKLADGTKAMYGNNGIASQLAWAKNGVLYTIGSENNKNQI